MKVGSWNAEDWSAFGQVGALVIAVVVGGFVAIQVLQAKRAREEQARPYVIVDFEFRRFLVRIAIKNIGATPALNVAVKFDKPLQQVNPKGYDINESSVFASPIPMLAPGRSIRINLDSGPAIFADGAVPLRYEASVTYSDVRGKTYEDPPFPLDLSPYKHTPIESKGLPDLVGELERVRKDLDKWSSSNGLRVDATSGDRRRSLENRAYYVQQARQVRKDQGLMAMFKWVWRELMFGLGLR